MLRCCTTPTVVITAAIVFLSFACPVNGQKLGQDYLQFVLSSTSLSNQARTNFADGLASLILGDTAMCVESFSKAQTAGGNKFPMATWGQAMCYYKPLMETQEYSLGTAVIETFESMRAEIDQLKARNTFEGPLVEAVQELFSKTNRDYKDRLLKYRTVLLNRITAQNGQEDVINLFYAASILPSTHYRGYFYDPEARTQALKYVDDVLSTAKNPKNPLANVLSLVLRDTPYTSTDAMQNAKTLLEIAPDNKQTYLLAALPKIRLGMWAEAAQVLQRGVEVPGSKVPVTYSRIQNYVNLHLGKLQVAKVLLETVVKGDDTLWTKAAAAMMKTDYLLFTERFGEEPVGAAPEVLTAPRKEPEYLGEYLFIESAYASRLFMYGVTVLRGHRDIFYGNRVADLLQGLVDALVPAFVTRMGLTRYKQELTLMVQQYKALLTYYKGATEVGIKRMGELAGQETSLGPPPSGSPTVPIWPLSESYAFLLYESKQYLSAQSAYQQTLSSYPNRTSALLGVARSAKAESRDDIALAQYSKLQAIWADVKVDASASTTAIVPKKEVDDFVNSRRQVVASAIGVGAGVVLQLQENNDQQLTPMPPQHPDLCPISQSSFVLTVLLLVIAIILLVLFILLLWCSMRQKISSNSHDNTQPHIEDDYAKAGSPTANLYTPVIYDTYEGNPALTGGVDGGYTDHWPTTENASPPPPLQSQPQPLMHGYEYDPQSPLAPPPMIGQDRAANPMAVDPTHGWELVPGGSPKQAAPLVQAGPRFASPGGQPVFSPGVGGADNYTYGGIPEEWH